MCSTAKFAVDWQLRVIVVRSTRFRRSWHVRFAPFAYEPSHNSNSTRCAISGREQMQHMTRANARLLDHVVGELLQLERHVKTERLGGLEIDDQLVLRRYLYRKVGRLVAL